MRDNNCPCNGCTERFTACSDHCPKDERGEFGYKAWLDKAHKDKAEQTKWRRQKSEDMKRDSRYGFRPKNRRY